MCQCVHYVKETGRKKNEATTTPIVREEGGVENGEDTFGRDRNCWHPGHLFGYMRWLQVSFYKKK